MIFQVNRFHAFALLTWQFGIFFATQMIFPIFSNYVPRWRCPKQGVDDGLSFLGEQRLFWPLFTILVDCILFGLLIIKIFSKNCSVWEECGGINNIEFEYEHFHSSAIEFEWICGKKAYWAPFYSQLQFIGALIGTVFWGSLSDCVGRKPIALFVFSLGVSMSFLSGIVPSWEWLLVTRFFIGLCIGGIIVVVCTLVMEMLLPQQRMALRAFFNWGTSRLFMTAICYVFPNWRTASIACALCTLPAVFIVLFIFPESPTWLRSKGKFEKLKESERKIARISGVKHVEVEQHEVVENLSFCALIRNPELFRRIFVLWIMWFVASICGYAIDLNSSNIVGNLFLNQTLFSILIAISKMFLVMYDTFRTSFSRRNLHQYSQFIVCVCFLILTVLVLFNEHGVIILVINLIGIVFIEYTWDACYLCGVESMPTNMRATAFGSCSFVARIGAIISPVLAFLNATWAPSAYLTVVILGALNLIISYTWLIETKGINLADVSINQSAEESKPINFDANDEEAASETLPSLVPAKVVESNIVQPHNEKIET